MRVCLICESALKPIQKRFCSRSCTKLFIARKPKIGKEKSCVICAKVFYVFPCIFHQMTCSHKCSSVLLWKEKRVKTKVNIDCPICHKSFSAAPSQIKINKNKLKFCSRKCKHNAMKQGLAKWGFKKLYKDLGSNPRKRIMIEGRRVYEHRHLMEIKLGRKLQRNECVHHINGNCKDNSIENLQVLSNKEHMRLHKKGER